MKKKSNFWAYQFVFIISLLLISCAGKDSSKEIDSNEVNKLPGYEKIAIEKYKSNYLQVFNESKNFVLIYHKTKQNEPLSFFVYDIAKNKIVTEQSANGGKVEWISDTQLKVTTIPGTVKGNEEENLSQYIYDVTLKKKINKLSDN